jgi:hypothetical protein
MNTSEGTRRIYLLAKRIMLFGSLVGIALWILDLVLKGGWGPGELFIFVAAPLACGATLWVIAWVVEGFMTSSKTEQEPR